MREQIFIKKARRAKMNQKKLRGDKKNRSLRD